MNNPNNNEVLTVLLEQYKHVNDEIRNYRVLHWQIATMLFALMGGIIGFGLSNVAEGLLGKLLVCVSTLLIFILHITTYYYFQMLEKRKKIRCEKIINKIKLIDPRIYFFNEKDEKNEILLPDSKDKKKCWLYNLFEWLRKNILTEKLLDCNPQFGFASIFFALFFFALALGIFPKNNQNQFNIQCTPNNYIKIYPDEVKANPQASVPEKKDQGKCDLEIIKRFIK